MASCVWDPALWSIKNIQMSHTKTKVMRDTPSQGRVAILTNYFLLCTTY